MKKKNVHIVPHTHWDREWYFTNSRSTVYLISQVNEVIDVLEKNPDTYYYLFDAQSSLIEDYLSFYPEKRSILGKLISDQRLLIGPWYTQTDQIAVAQESIVRNLYYGIKFAKQLGHSMMIGYCPDIFGQGGNMPQIYQKFGIRTAIIWRGIGHSKLKQNEFLWEGDDGTKILAIQMPFGYFFGANIPENVEELKQFSSSMIPKLEQRSAFNQLYLPNGVDQLPINHRLNQIVTKLNVIDTNHQYMISSPEQYLVELRNDIRTKEDRKLPTIKGELLDGEDSRVHKSIYSTRADLKKKNNQLENYVTHILEPISTLGYLCGLRYPHREIEHIWKIVFKNAAHDSIGNCNSDSTNFDIGARNKLAHDFAQNITEKMMRDISMNIKTDHDYSFTVFNTMPVPRSEVLDTFAYLPGGSYHFEDTDGNEILYEVVSRQDQSDYVLHQAELLTPNMYRSHKKKRKLPQKVYYTHIKFWVDNVPGLGYKQFYLFPDESAVPITIHETNQNRIENEYYQVWFDSCTRTFNVKDKKTSRVYTRQFEIIENGDGGDSYNYSPPYQDLSITSSEAQVVQIKSHLGVLEQSITVQMNFQVPQDLSVRALKQKNELMPLSLCVSLNRQDPVVHVAVKVDNRVLSHRVRFRCHTDIHSQNSLADGLFGTVQRPFVHSQDASWQQCHWVEKPIELNPLQSFAALSDAHATVAVFTDGAREYEVTGKHFSDLTVTLFRTYSYMGKEKLLYRPGRASGETIVPTPDAEMLGINEFTLGVYYSDQTFDQAKVGHVSKMIYSPLQCYELAPFLNSRIRFIRNEPSVKKLPVQKGFLDISGSTAVVSALKKAEKGSSVIIRCFNNFIKNSAAVIFPDDAESVDLDEATRAEQKDTGCHFTLATSEFKTYKLTIGDENLDHNTGSH
ncbi:glycoside hydrolase family 38 C-terminal domain-containing protein [Sporolactobacillus sp. Y61]|uniref:Glycoside hydrolase family 38 C-terminal domain-containing protein n=1 Tax=Sporolactobacillus sp. Y61 TaxID=3160863 RepID=A0AAU8IHC5_9BACL